MRRPFIAGNWKLNLGPTDAASLAAELKDRLADRGGVDVAVFPTALSLHTAIPALRGSGIGVGVQDVEVAASGAFTGANSAEMARTMGCEYALVGHSERRQLYGETDAQVGARCKAALSAGLLPIVCVGETLQQRRAGDVDTVIQRQLTAALAPLAEDQLGAITLAYEPVWAIGTGETATPETAQQVHAGIRAWLRASYPAWVADQMRIQYGGSVKPHNAAELLSCPDIDGALVGGASLSADAFAAIIDAA
jgi:triosephosphate isomerase